MPDSARAVQLKTRVRELREELRSCLKQLRNERRNSRRLNTRMGARTLLFVEAMWLASLVGAVGSALL